MTDDRPPPRDVVDELERRMTIPAPTGNPEAFERPKWVDLFGIDPDFTGGMPVDAWLDEQRGEA